MFIVHMTILYEHNQGRAGTPVRRGARSRATRPKRLQCGVHFIPLLAAFLALAPPDPVSISVAGPARTFPAAAAEGGNLISVPDMALGLGGRATAQPGAALAVELNGHRIVAADGVATVAFDDRVVILGHPTRAFSGVLYAPWEFFEKTVLPAAGLSGEYDRAGKKIRTRAGAPAATAVDVTVIHFNRVTQVVFRESAAVEYETSGSKDGYTVTFKRPVEPAATDRSFEDPLVSRVHFGGNTAAIVFREPGLAVNAYPLKSPDRLVLEITRPENVPASAPAAGNTAAPPGPAPAPVPPMTQRAVVIDPGHGGDETGAIGPGNVIEKEVTLDIASRLAAILGRDPSVRPVLTRTNDTIVALDERAAIANHERASVFLSIHANSSRAGGAHGSETYYLSLGSTDSVSAAVAHDENTAAATGAPPPPSAPADLDFILWDMAQSAHLKESATLAESIQNELNGLLHTENRGIKQAPFRVLVGATMPAVLVEAAFISNAEEARELATPEFRQSIAEAIARAVVSFLQQHPIAPPA
jgi:N-acetylmuramoyl-L-alanine amidase